MLSSKLKEAQNILFHLFSGKWYKVQTLVFYIEGHILYDLHPQNSRHVVKVVGPWSFNEIYLQSSSTHISY